MYRYQIKKGAENREFTNCRRLSVNVVESDEPLNSVYLDLIEPTQPENADAAGQAQAEQMTAAAPNPPVNPPPVAPVAAPVSPTLPPSNPPQNEQANKEAN